MDTENFSQSETRKTLKHLALWIMAILVLRKLLAWADILFQAA